jgi:hypothetical protein
MIARRMKTLGIWEKKELQGFRLNLKIRPALPAD